MAQTAGQPAPCVSPVTAAAPPRGRSASAGQRRVLFFSVAVLTALLVFTIVALIFRALLLNAPLLRWVPVQGWMHGHFYFVWSAAQRWAEIGFFPYLLLPWVVLFVSTYSLVIALLRKDSEAARLGWLALAAAEGCVLISLFLVLFYY